MSTVVYTIDDSDLSIGDVRRLRRAGVSGDMDTVYEILNRIIIVPDGKTFEDLNHRLLKEIVTKVISVTNGVEVPNS